jgi:hypothetical protein
MRLVSKAFESAWIPAMRLEDCRELEWIDEVTLIIDQIQSSPAVYICSERSAEDNYVYSSIRLRLLDRFERLS